MDASNSMLTCLIPIKKITTYHNISFFDRRKFTKPNINVLIEKGCHVIYYELLNALILNMWQDWEAMKNIALKK